MEMPQKTKQNDCRIQQFQLWVYSQKNWKGYLYTCVHGITHNSQEVQLKGSSTDEQNVVYLCSGILFSLKNEGNSDIGCNIYEP